MTRDPLTGADPRQGLDSFLRPRSIVLLGATERSVWTRSAFANLKALGFEGKVHLVNRRGGQVLGRTAATSAASIGDAVDIALLMVPSDALLDTFPDLKAAGIHNAVLLSSGFAEAGTAGKQRQALLVDTARAHGVRLLKDTSLRLLPVSPDDVEEMLSELRGRALLDGFRGAPVVDRARLATMVVAIGEAALALGPDLVSLEINPLMVSGAGLEALDALAVWADAPTTTAPR